MKRFSRLFGEIPSRLWLLFALYLTISSCSPKTAGVTSRSGNYDRESLEIQHIDFDYLTIKSKIEFHEASNSKNATALIRVKKDSVIWFNLSGTLGVQGIRGLLTQDSIRIVNRVDKEYWTLDYKQLSQEFNFNIDFGLIQAMILGEMPKPKKDDETITREKGNFVIHQQFGDFYIDNFISASTRKITEVNILEAPTRNSLTLMYGDFQPVENQYFPFSSFVSLIHNNEFGELETKVDIAHSKVDIPDKPLRFPFSIPDRYAER